MASIQKRGSTWVVEVCIDRKRQSKSFATKREATAWGNEKEQNGLAPRKTLSDLIEKYRPIAEKHRGYQAELSRMNHLAGSDIGNVLLDRITPARLAEYRDSRLKEVAPVSVRREMIILSAMFKIAVDEWGWLSSNPLGTVKKPSPSKARMRGITSEEIETICKNLAPMRAGKQVEAMFLFAIETGMRLSEILSIQWEDVSDKTVFLQRTKNGDSRTVPLSLKAREIIAGRRGIDPESVFTLAAHTASKAFQRASVSGVHFHDSRSEAITRLSKKLEVMQLAKMIGHRDLRSLMIYYAEKAEEMADKL